MGRLCFAVLVLGYVGGEWVVVVVAVRFWRGCAFVGLVGCRKSAEWFGGWWAGVGDWFWWECVLGGCWGGGDSSCLWVVVDGVSVVGGGWRCGGCA